MRALFGLVGLVVVVAFIAMAMKKQLQAVAPGVVPATPTAGGTPPTLPEQSRAAQQKVLQDVNKALQQGAASRAAD